MKIKVFGTGQKILLQVILQGLKMKDKVRYLYTGDHGVTFYPSEPLLIDFDKDAKLEYKRPHNARPYRKIWIEIDPHTFRSWGGERRVNGKRFYGKVWYLGSNEVSREAGK